MVPPYTATSRLGATQVAMVLESSAVEESTLQLEPPSSTPPEETRVRELERLHCADSKSDFSEALSTIVIVHSVKCTQRCTLFIKVVITAIQYSYHHISLTEQISYVAFLEKYFVYLFIYLFLHWSIPLISFATLLCTALNFILLYLILF